jgi:hypothetical protein
MAVVGHERVFVEQELLLLTVALKDFQEEVPHSIGLEKIPLTGCIGGDEVGAGPNVEWISRWPGHF